MALREALGEAPSLVVVATLDDATGMVERPNLPGTIDEWPNWRIPLRRMNAITRSIRSAESISART